MKVLKIGAEWCAACLTMGPRWAEIEQELPWLETEYVDADENEELLDEYQVKDIPTFIFLSQDQKELERMSGLVEKDKLVAKVKELKDK
ncbi:MAG: thiol reductase thioredoxin [Candidatus Pacebacteria bacterium]|nr:thiol reductase thioredoxin [Candidatus Paceibacterota bacterium]